MSIGWRWSGEAERERGREVRRESAPKDRLCEREKEKGRKGTDEVERDWIGGEDRTRPEVLVVVDWEGERETKECESDQDELEEEEEESELDEEDETDRLMKVFRREEVKVMVVDGVEAKLIRMRV